MKLLMKGWEGGGGGGGLAPPPDPILIFKVLGIVLSVVNFVAFILLTVCGCKHLCSPIQ